MNHDETLDALDRRGREAAGALKERVAERPVPVFDPDVLRVPIDAPRAKPGVGRRGLLAIAAVVLLVVGVGVALARTGSDDSSTPPATVPADELRRYVLADAPADMTLVYASDAPRQRGERFASLGIEGSMTVYGPSVEDPRLAISAVPRDGGSTWSPGALSPVDVDGRDAWDVSEIFGFDALLVDVDEWHVLLVGSSEVAREAAAAVVVDGDEATLPDESVPDGWRDLGSVVDSTDATWTAVYEDATSTDVPFMVLSVMPGERLDVTRVLLAGDQSRAVEVRGHPGVLTVGNDGGAHVVVLRWEERPGEVVELLASSGEAPPDADEVLALVEDLEVVASDEVTALAVRLRRAAIEGSGATIVGEGAFADGSSWILATGAEPGDPWSLSVDGQVDPDDRIWDVGAVAPEATLDARVGWTSDDRLVAFGAVTPDAATVEVRSHDGDVLAEATVVTGDGAVAGWVTELPDGTPIDEASGPDVVVVALAADGTEISQLTF